MTAISYDSIDRNRLDNPNLHGFSLAENKAQVRSEKVHLEDPEFRKHFEVFSNDQIEARYILTKLLSILETLKLNQNIGM